ncbi:putative benzoate 4-monooxygenase cytochrome P450 protein [Rosellinia necatrix]|uniref:Putative benzoate 4-monooxygenase cytochrome P450 protein n=1 Tax=Rosellinia necatrix TaxID=77044 RepID=A0A1S7UP46_ROSNE|nr:putative benzoate 4-monooxygenase cytochrome P450 protein [Rosellinia necatrix]
MSLFEPSMLEQVDIFLRQIYASAGSVEDITNRAEWLGIDIIGLISFGYRLNLQTDKTYRFIPKDFEDLKAIINTFMQFPAASVLNPVVSYLNSTKRERLRKIIFQMMLARAARERDAERDFYSYVKGNLDYGPDYIDKGNFIAEAAFFVTAGGTPPATVICALFFYLMRYPECYERLVREIRGTFSSGGGIKGDAQLMGCDYLRACIDETLRMSPPSLTTLWREHDKDDDDRSSLVVDGVTIPPGTQIGINMYSLHHNEEYFADSYTFSPERWQQQQQFDSSEAPARMREAFVPFLQGTRSCAGKAMAYAEVSIVVAKTLWYFDVEGAPGEPGRLGEGVPGAAAGRHRVNEYQMHDCNSAAHVGPNLIFRPRPEAHVDLGAKR